MDRRLLYYRAWLQAGFGYDAETSGSHAGITDTSPMLFIRPAGIRKDQIKAWGGPQDSGVSGDPAKATAEIGRMGVEFKVNAGIAQYKALKNPPQGRGREREGDGVSKVGIQREDTHLPYARQRDRPGRPRYGHEEVTRH